MQRVLAAAVVIVAGAGVALGVYGVTTPPHVVPITPLPTPTHRSALPPGPSSTVVPTRAHAPTTAKPPTPNAPGVHHGEPIAKVVRSAPVHLNIPSLSISSALGPPRGLNADGAIDDAPLSGPTWSLPWWYDKGPAPGQNGSAVILGHVDSALGAGRLGVFFTLGKLTPGRRVDVTLADGTVTVWQVVSTRLYTDDDFPDATVYDPWGPRLLRLITCGGTFDWTTHEYESATVVTARPARSEKPTAVK